MRAFALLVLLLLPMLCHAEQVLRFSAMESWAMPLARFDEGQLTDGILFDLYTETAKRLGAKADIRTLPRARIEQAMQAHSIDVRCYISPTWLLHNVDSYRWSTPLLIQRDLLVAKDPTPTEPDQLPRQAIGTVLGYRYPHLQPLFDKGQLQRDDARNQELVLRKLEVGRYRYAISSEVALDWFNQGHPEPERLHSVAVVDETQLGCLVLDTPEHPAQPVLEVLQRLNEEGVVARILARYR